MRLTPPYPIILVDERAKKCKLENKTSDLILIDLSEAFDILLMKNLLLKLLFYDIKWTTKDFLDSPIKWLKFHQHFNASHRAQFSGQYNIWPT